MYVPQSINFGDFEKKIDLAIFSDFCKEYGATKNGKWPKAPVA